MSFGQVWNAVLFSVGGGMARAGLGDAAAGLSEPEQRVMLLERLYGGDLSPLVMSALIARIRTT